MDWTRALSAAGERAILLAVLCAWCSAAAAADVSASSDAAPGEAEINTPLRDAAAGGLSAPAAAASAPVSETAAGLLMAPADDSTAPLENLARDVLPAPSEAVLAPLGALPHLPSDQEGAAGVEEAESPVIGGGAAASPPQGDLGPPSLAEIFGEGLRGGAVAAKRPVTGLFSERLPAFLAPDPLLLHRRPAPRPAARVGYTLGDNLHAFFNYSHARTFATASSRAVRQYRYADFSTNSDRDVLGLLMAWSWSNSTVDLGYRLESARGGQLGEGRTLSSLVTGNGVDHALTLGITQRWGGAGD